MKIYTQKELKEYKKNDETLQLMDKLEQDFDKKITSHRWLKDSLPKRMIYWDIYGDLVKKKNSKKTVLDVGGGFCSISRLLVKNHNYYLLDIMDHDHLRHMKKIKNSLKKKFLISKDWYEYSSRKQFDLIIANDLFPNVDQRLELFLEKYLKMCKEMKLTLTYYNNPRFYKTKRLNAKESLWFLAWNGRQLKSALRRYISRIKEPKLDILDENPHPIFSNKRLVCSITFNGEMV